MAIFIIVIYTISCVLRTYRKCCCKFRLPISNFECKTYVIFHLQPIGLQKQTQNASIELSRGKAPSISVVKENSAALFCCEAPEIIFGVRNVTRLSIGTGVSRQSANFHFWVHCSFSNAPHMSCILHKRSTCFTYLIQSETENS